MPVTEIMSESIVTSLPHRSPERAISLIRQRKITHLVIADDDKKLLGIVSAYDLIKEFNNIKTVDEIMLPADPVLLDSDTAKDAIIMIDDAPHGMIPVVDNHRKVVGLVTRGSLLSAMSSPWTETEEDINE